MAIQKKKLVSHHRAHNKNDVWGIFFFFFVKMGKFIIKMTKCENIWYQIDAYSASFAVIYK